MPDEFFKALVSYSDLTNWAIYHDNPEYIKKTINFNYWYKNAKKKDSSNKGSRVGLYILVAISTITVFVSSLILLVLFKCKENDDKNYDSSVIENE